MKHRSEGLDMRELIEKATNLPSVPKVLRLGNSAKYK